MFKIHFDEIINFAIDREKEAVDFYRNLQGRVKFKAQKDMLFELEKMEEGHVTMLQNLLKRDNETIKLREEVRDLKISNYLVEKEPSDNMDYQDILILAMKREEKSTELYQDLATQVDDGETKTLFVRLSQEEAAHKLKFETLYDDVVLKEN